VTVPVTDESAASGHIRLWCSIGSPPTANGSGELIAALAHVPGGVAPKVIGNLGVERYRPGLGRPTGDALPGVKLYLRDQVDGKIVARAVTGPDGNFAFYDVPAGLYRFGVVGPWEFTYGTEIIVRTGENGSTMHWVLVRPGPYQPDPDAVPPGGDGPAPPPPLAVTGAGVTWLALGGLLSVIAGSALVLGTPRRLRR